LLNISPIALRLGPLNIRWYAILIALGIAIGILMSCKEAKKIAFSRDVIIDFVIYTLPLGFLGARLYYVIFNFSYYLANPAEIFALWHGGLAIYGGLITSIVCLFFFCKKRKLSFLKFLDILTPSVLMAQIIGRWGNFFNQEAHGFTTTKSFLHSTLHLPNFIVEGMNIDGIYYQPTFLYESLWNLLGLLLILLLRHWKDFYCEGEIFWQYVAWYAFGRFFIESLRSDSLMIFNKIHISQALSFIFFFLALFYLLQKTNRKALKK
jgi:phosphatidylglycerol:prolipoprotein diacylglycerol transferase